MDLYKWRKAVEDGKLSTSRKNMAVILMDEEGKEKARWNFSKAWPTKYDPADMNATANEIAIETMEIAHEKMERVSGPIERPAMTLQTEHDFTLPKGFVDKQGTLHKDGRMRLATAADDPPCAIRVKANPAYLTVIVLSRVITRLGSLEDMKSRPSSRAYIEDLAYSRPCTGA